MPISPDSIPFDTAHLATPYVPLDFTHVFYKTDDPFSLAMAVCSLIPQGILVSYATLMLSRREIETFMLFAGQLSAEIVTEIIKSIIKQDRPGEFGSGYGMPSAHSQFSCFYASYLTFWLLFRATQIPLWNRLLRIAGLLTLALSVSYSRVYLTYHSNAQVLVGMALGTTLGALWMLAVSFFRYIGLVDFVLDLKIAEWFYIKDTALQSKSYITDEYARWKSQRNSQKQKKSV